MTHFKNAVSISFILFSLSIFATDSSKDQRTTDEKITTKLAFILDSKPTKIFFKVTNNSKENIKISSAMRLDSRLNVTDPSGELHVLGVSGHPRVDLNVLHPQKSLSEEKELFSSVKRGRLYEVGFYKLQWYTAGYVLDENNDYDVSKKSARRHYDSNEISVFAGEYYDKYTKKMTGDALKLKLALMLDRSPSMFVIRLENMSKETLKTTPFGIDDNSLLITTPDGKTVEYSKDSGDFESVVVPSKTKKDWKFELTSIFKELSLTDTGFYNIQWKCAGKLSNELLIYVKDSLKLN